MNLTTVNNYVKTANDLPFLTLEKEVELATRYRSNGDLEAAQELVLSHFRLVVNIARGLNGYGLPIEDLIQEGSIGLMKAVKRFDPTRGVRLISFALHFIKAEMYNFILNNWRIVKIATTKSQRKLFFNLRSLHQKLCLMTSQEVTKIAQTLNVHERDVIEMEARFANYEIPLEQESDDENFNPVNYLAGDSDLEPLNFLETSQMKVLSSEGLARALEHLDSRARRIIEARWLCKDGEAATLHDLSIEFGVSLERIRQIEQQTLKKMRTTFEDFA